ncbi:MAG: hypothetical protein ACI3Z9_04400 [Candidatus Onthomorpha sp.]
MQNSCAEGLVLCFPRVFAACRLLDCKKEWVFSRSEVNKKCRQVGTIGTCGLNETLR